MDIDFTNPSTDAKLSQLLSALFVDDTGATLIKGVSCKQVTIDPPSLATTADGVATATFPGAAVGDGVILIPPYDMQEIMHSGAISAADTIEATFYNGNSGTINLASGTWIAIVLHRA